jgi:signal transduction histidine kinase
MAWNVVQALVLFGSSALAVWVGATAFERQSLPGRSWLGWMQLAIAFWCLTACVNAILDVTPERILISKFQYIGIMALPTCWFEFARSYTRRPPSPTPWLIWLIPAATVILAFSNDSHHLLWREIREMPPVGGVVLLQYVHGPWFAIAAGFTYVALAVGTVWLAIAVRQQPLQYRYQGHMLLLALLAPWLGNLAYISGEVPIKGLDPTPVAFAISGLFFAVGLFRYHLFDLVPVARTVLFDSLGDAAFVIDRDGRIVDSNAAARAIVPSGPGARPGSGGSVPLGEPIERVLPWWNQRPHVGSASEVVYAGGRAFDVQLRPVLDDSRELSAWLVIVRDVTDRERAEAERRALDHRLVEEQQVKTLSLLAGGLAHDFKSLLTGIIGNADLAAVQLPPDADAHESVRAIITAAERATELVARMQDYAGAKPLTKQIVDLRAVTSDMVALLQSSSARHCRVGLDLTERPVLAVGDPTQLRQILLNLIVNAAESVAPDGSIDVKLTTGTAETSELPSASFDATRPGSHNGVQRYAVLDVIDTGSGMPAAVVARIFDPFYSTKAAGRGLGLSAVLGIVRGHEGAIRIRSQPGEGTAARVWIPAPQ